MTQQDNIDRQTRVNEMLIREYKGVKFPCPGVCTNKWDTEDWKQWIENHRTN